MGSTADTEKRTAKRIATNILIATQGQRNIWQKGKGAIPAGKCDTLQSHHSARRPNRPTEKRKAEQRKNIVQDKDSASEMAIKDSDVEQVDRLHTLTLQKIQTTRCLGTQGKVKYQNIDQVEISETSHNSKQTK